MIVKRAVSAAGLDPTAYSGHSLRAGFVTSAAAVDVPPLRIAQHTRHKSLEMVNRYCREADKYNRSALKGVFAPATEEQP